MSIQASGSSRANHAALEHVRIQNWLIDWWLITTYYVTFILTHMNRSTIYIYLTFKHCTSTPFKLHNYFITLFHFQYHWPHVKILLLISYFSCGENLSNFWSFAYFGHNISPTYLYNFLCILQTIFALTIFDYLSG